MGARVPPSTRRVGLNSHSESLRRPDIERLVGALRHRPTDRVPNFEHRIKGRNIAGVLGREAGEDSARLAPGDQLELVQRIHQDAVPTDMRWELGFVYRETSDGAVSYVDGAIKDVAALDGIVPPSLDDLRERLAHLVRITSGTSVGVSCGIGGPLSTAYLAMGLTDFSLKLYDDLPFVERLLDVTTDFCCRAVDTVVEGPADVVWIMDDMAFSSGPMMRPEMVRQLWLERIREVIRPALDRGVPVVLHSDGNLTSLLPTIVEAGFDGLHPNEPCDGAFDILRTKAEFGQELCLFGNIDVSGVLSYGHPDEVREVVRERIERLSEGGGYVVSSSHSIQDSVPPENFEAMLEAVLAYGSY